MVYFMHMKKIILSFFIILSILSTGTVFASTRVLEITKNLCGGSTCGNGEAATLSCEGLFSTDKAEGDSYSPSESMTLTVHMWAEAASEGRPTNVECEGILTPHLFVSRDARFPEGAPREGERVTAVISAPATVGSYSFPIITRILFRGISDSVSGVLPYTVSQPTSQPTLQLNGSAAFLRALSTPVFAQESSSVSTGSENKQKISTLIADVGIRNATILGVKNRTISTSFVLSAGMAQENIRYGLTLAQKEGSAYKDVFVEVASETLNLGQQESKDIQAIFSIPESVIAGSYGVFITAYTTKGIILASKYIQDVSLTGAAPVASITCAEPTSVNVATTSCVIKNNTKLAQVLNVYTVTRTGDTFFGVDTGTPIKQVITLKPAQSQIITVAMTPNISQTFGVYLKSANDSTVIDRSFIKRVTPLRPSLDNVFMVATDKVVTVSAVTRRVSEGHNVKISLIGTDGIVCATGVMPVTSIRTDVVLNPTCEKGKAQLMLVDANEQVIDQEEVEFKLFPKIKDTASNNDSTGWFIGGLLLAVLVILFFTSRRKQDLAM